MKYTIVNEDSEIYVSEIITENDKEMCNEGYLSILDNETGREYYDGKWWEPKICRK